MAVSLSKLTIIIGILAFLLYFVKVYFNGPVCESTTRLDKKTVLITGGNSGLGFETAVQLALRGGTIYITCRSKAKCDQSVQHIKNRTSSKSIFCEVLDLASLQSVRDFVASFKKREPKLDILINNAGYIGPRRLTADGYEQTLAVNHLGHFLLTDLLLDVLKAAAPSRVVTVTGDIYRAGSYFSSFALNLNDLMSETDYSDVGVYARSKTANLLFSYELAKRLNGTGVNTYALHPGVISTGLASESSMAWMKPVLNIFFWPFIKDSFHGVQTTICCAIDEKLAKDSGKYYKDIIEHEPEPFAVNDDTAKQLWDASAKLVGIS